jgi:hypothetical protein
MLIESLELNLGIGHLHNFVEFAVLFSADEISVFIRQLNLESDFVMEALRKVSE